MSYLSLLNLKFLFKLASKQFRIDARCLFQIELSHQGQLTPTLSVGAKQNTLLTPKQELDHKQQLTWPPRNKMRTESQTKLHLHSL